MGNAVLVIGASPAGLQAVCGLADLGQRVHWVTSSPFPMTETSKTKLQHVNDPRFLDIAKYPNVTIWMHSHVNRIDTGAGGLQVELCNFPRFVALDRCTGCGDCIDACPVMIPGTVRKAIHLKDGAQPSCAAVDKSGAPPCSHACPGGIQVQGYVALIAQERFGEALDLIRKAIPFPGICGRICTHPCEINCRRNEVDTPVSIRLLKRFVSSWEDEQHKVSQTVCDPKPTIAGRARRVAIVGAGPGGMTVADRLIDRGYRVTVFDKLPVVGGMMAVGIPEYRLPKEVIAAEYRRSLDRGVELRLNTTIGPEGDFTLDDLFKKGYEAVCLAIGAHKGLALQIPGEDLPGVAQGIELLKLINLSRQRDDPQSESDLRRLLRRGAETRVTVIGGGNTAIDVSRSLKRLGIGSVQVFYRRTQAEMPALPEEVEYACQEKVTIEYLTAPVRILGDPGNGVTSLECIRMQLGAPDGSGRRRPLPIPASEFRVDSDLVVVAIGQRSDLRIVDQDSEIQLTPDQRIKVGKKNYMTARTGVFAVGDVVTRNKRAVIEAIRMGKEAADEIDAFLNVAAPTKSQGDVRPRPVSEREMTPDELGSKPPVPIPVLDLKERLQSFGEVERGFSPRQAVAEAQRCLVCGPCSECMACVNVCKAEAIEQAQLENFSELDIAAIIYADNPDQAAWEPYAKMPFVYHARPENPQMGLWAAAKALQTMDRSMVPAGVPAYAKVPDDSARIGIYICACGDRIARVIDINEVCHQAAAWSHVYHTREVSFACHPEMVETLSADVKSLGLNRLVLAACACCNINQVCDSCTYQRVRCKGNLGLFKRPNAKSEAGAQSAPIFEIGRANIELVNIREQCAWAHAKDPLAATQKATALIAAATAKIRTPEPEPGEIGAGERKTFILGRHPAARFCQIVLDHMGIANQHVTQLPQQNQETIGHCGAKSSGCLRPGTGIVLAPEDKDEAMRLWAVLGQEGFRFDSRSISKQGTHPSQGIFTCDTRLNPEIAGMAVGMQVGAWMGRTGSAAVAAVVDPARCRACQTCCEYCPYEASRMREEEGGRSAWIDPALCVGCGICSAHCPSDAINAGDITDTQMEAVLDAILT